MKPCAGARPNAQRIDLEEWVATVAIDFDGVIHRYSRGWGDGTIYDEPMSGAIEGIKRLQEQYAVFVFTSREVEQVIPWLAAHGLDVAPDGPPYPQFWNGRQILVTNRKLPAVAYVDDRAVVFSSWTQLPAQLDGAGSGNFGPPCCPDHGRRCEPGEYCCDLCVEHLHGYGHRATAEGGLTVCSAPDLSS